MRPTMVIVAGDASSRNGNSAVRRAMTISADANLRNQYVPGRVTTDRTRLVLVVAVRTCRLRVPVVPKTAMREPAIGQDMRFGSAIGSSEGSRLAGVRTQINHPPGKLPGGGFRRENQLFQDRMAAHATAPIDCSCLWNELTRIGITPAVRDRFRYHSRRFEYLRFEVGDLAFNPVGQRLKVSARPLMRRQQLGRWRSGRYQMGILLAHSREPIAEDAPHQLWIAVRKPCGEEWLGLGAHQGSTEIEAMAGAAVLLESKRLKLRTTRLQLMAILTLENHGRRGVWNSRKPVGVKMKSMTEFETRVIAEVLTRGRRNVSQDFGHGLPIQQ